MKILTFDLEIKKGVPDKNEPKIEGIEYCEGWEDKKKMGISLGCARLSWENRFKFYDELNILDLITDFQAADLVVGFNIWNFDTPLLKATLIRLGLPEETGMAGKCYDLFADIQNSHPPEVGRYAKGWKMGQVGKGTLGIEKDGEGAMAPVLYQQGRMAELATYLLQDVNINSQLMDCALKHGCLINEEGHTVVLKGIKKWQNWTPELGAEYIAEAKKKKEARKNKEI